MRSFSWAAAALLVTAACSGGSDEVDLGPADSGTTDTGGTPLDMGPLPTDMGPADTGVLPDSGPTDTGPGMDSGPMDMGPSSLAMTPGTGITLNAGSIVIGQDSFTTVTALLGAGTRQPGNGNRSYQWTVDGAEIAVWFANTNLDGDDEAPADVDGDDRVLWIAAGSGFSGQTPEGLGLGASRAAVEGQYGQPDNEVDLTSPPGRLAQYFRGGMLVTYDPQDNVRTWTMSRAYPVAPDGEIDPDDARLRLTGGDVQGLRSIAQPGTRESDVRALLGPPDAEGNVSLSGQNLKTLSYGFIGIEVFFLGNSSSVLFVSTHIPYYGTLPGGAGIGATRAQVDAALSGYTARNSSTQGLVCYEGNELDVGVTFGQDGTATTITVPLLRCP